MKILRRRCKMGKLNFNLPSADDLFSTQDEREE